MTPKPKHSPKIDVRDPAYLLDRELAWLAFNGRVLEEAEDETTPLLERLRFLGICASNMDEFFMVRVSGVQEQVHAEAKRGAGENTALHKYFRELHETARRQVVRMYEVFGQRVRPALERQGIHIRRIADLTKQQHEYLREFFDREVFPVLTPLAVDSGHPFPHLRNLSLNLAVRLSAPKGARTNFLFAVVQVPSVLDRLVRIPARVEGHFEFLLLEDLISSEIKLLFPGVRVQEVRAFRVIRDADLDFAEEEADDLLKTIENELRQRERGHAVRLGVEAASSPELVKSLSATLGLKEYQVYPLDGPINLSEVAQITNIVPRDDLKFRPFTPALREPLRSEPSILRAISRQDILLHHPYESFSPVVEFIEQAANDPNVLAIKQTLYRTSGDSAIIKALMQAAERGKQVAALMEIKARFDEERNISWARKMERAGIHVVYGLVGLKTHAKICLVVRKEEGGLRRYAHLSTGNYNPITARVYTDIGLLTCDPDLCDDASELFNMLTGYSRNPEWRKMLVAPVRARQALLDLIDAQIERARQGKGGRLRAKMNALTDPLVIGKLYDASNAGVQIDLMVRGVCCLRPGIKGVSENIRVSSIVDRFLEHSRLFIFGEGQEEQVFIGSADWMQRNLDRRVEIFFPIEAPDLKRRVVEEIWGTAWRDNVKRRVLLPDGSYERAARGDKEQPLRSQAAFLELEAQLREAPAPGKDARAKGLVTPILARTDDSNDAIPIRPAQPVARTLNLQGKEVRKALPELLLPSTILPKNDEEDFAPALPANGGQRGKKKRG